MQSMNYRLDIRNESSTHDVWERVLRTKRTVRVQHAEWMDCTIAMATHTGAYVYIIIDCMLYSAMRSLLTRYYYFFVVVWSGRVCLLLESIYMRIQGSALLIKNRWAF